jgi:hypothetical protein
MSASGQLSASLGAITARQLQALVRRQPFMEAADRAWYGRGITVSRLACQDTAALEPRPFDR